MTDGPSSARSRSERAQRSDRTACQQHNAPRPTRILPLLPLQRPWAQSSDAAAHALPTRRGARAEFVACTGAFASCVPRLARQPHCLFPLPSAHAVAEARTNDLSIPQRPSSSPATGTPPRRSPAAAAGGFTAILVVLFYATARSAECHITSKRGASRHRVGAPKWAPRGCHPPRARSGAQAMSGQRGARPGACRGVEAERV